MFKRRFTHKKKSDKFVVAEQDKSVPVTPAAKITKTKKRWRNFFPCFGTSGSEKPTRMAHKSSTWNPLSWFNVGLKHQSGGSGLEADTSSSIQDLTQAELDPDELDELLASIHELEEYFNLSEDKFLTKLKDGLINGNKNLIPKTPKKRKPTDPRGFPNMGNTCYMNSTLQSLLTLEDFISSISSTEHIWGSLPQAEVLRKLIDIKKCHTSTDSKSKKDLLCSLKDSVSKIMPNFKGNSQNDAHEFLTALLGQIQSLSPQLQMTAAVLGTNYTCPVEDHLGFKMEIIRTCKRCGLQSTREEEFSNLSLELIPRASIEEMLDHYLKEEIVEYSCECGGALSAMAPAFATLPRVLILHLKRFCLTPTYNLEKMEEPVRLQRDLVVSSKQGGGCYSLVSTINHLGTTESGHYICDGIHPEDSPHDPTDRWLTFNDAVVSKTTGSDVCKTREELAYILFYRRNF